MSASTGKIACVVLSYWFISISMVFANKYLLGAGTADLSLFVAWAQCIVCVMLVLSLQLSLKFYAWKLPTEHLQLESSYSLKPTLAPKVLMLTCSFCAMLTFNNLCLTQVSVAFYQIARSLTLLFVALLSCALLGQRLSPRIVFCCLIVVAGFVLGVDQEKVAGTLSVKGVVFGVITSMTVALNGVFTKRALDAVDHDSVKLTFYNNLNATVVFVPLLLVTGQASTAFADVRLYQVHFWVCLFISGIFGFLISWVSALQIDLTSPVTHHISTNAKAALQTVIAVIVYHDNKSLLWWLSIAMVIGGATSYALVRLREQKEEKQEKVEIPK